MIATYCVPTEAAWKNMATESDSIAISMWWVWWNRHFYRLVSRSRDSGENAHKWYREHAQAELPWSPGASDGADSTGDPLARLAAKVIIYMYI